MQGPGGKQFTVQSDAQQSFPFFGFLAHGIGDANQSCVCATPHPQDSTRCVVDASTCLSIANLSSTSTTTVARELTDACARPSRAYTQAADAGAILASLLLPASAGVRCPELGPSDLLWGLAPVGASGNDESVHASAWVGTATSDITYEGARFLHEPRAGLRLSNYGHVNATYHASISYAASVSPASSAQLPRCFAPEELLAPDYVAGEDLSADNATDLLTKQLFPAAQLVGDSPLVAVCTRYLVEVARATALSETQQARTSALQASAWRRRCGAKVREAAACAYSGVLFDTTPPPSLFGQSDTACQMVSVSSLATTPVQLAAMVGGGSSAVYVTPHVHGCVVVDRAARRFYDGPLCAHLANRAGGVLTQWADLTDACAIDPWALLTPSAPSYAMLFGSGGARLSLDWLANLAPSFTLDVVAKDSAARRSPSRDRVSHVYDWWPSDDDDTDGVLGLHVTASPHASDEFAPILFDSHYAFDASTMQAFYVHSMFRNATLLPNTFGAGGVCRAPNVGMPMWDTNTNRVCTRMTRAVDASPSEPPPPSSSSSQQPQTPADMDAAYFPEFCSPTHDDVPYAASTAHGAAAGDVAGWRALATLSATGATMYPYNEYPPAAAGQSSASAHPELFAELFPAQAWTDACAVPWAPPQACSLSAASCPTGSVCLALTKEAGVCVSAAIARNVDPTRTPCFMSTHCPADTDVCLADGACAPLQMHVWNRAEHTWDMEVTMLADDCGFADAVHPYTQSTRGASPWEIVPDLLHMHGFCGHHHWYAYRNALAQPICPLLDDNSAAACPLDTSNSSSSSSSRWPWVQMRFDGKRSVAPYQTLADGRALQTAPHPCDQAFMHLQNPFATQQTQQPQRMQVCSGNGGHEARALSARYSLKGNTWAGVTSLKASDANASRWLRTYDEASNAIHVGRINQDPDADVPLGFLGANAAAPDVRSEMATPEAAEFFYCVAHMGCSNPHHTYNGVTVDRLDPQTLRSNFSELSLRLCGAVGYTAAEWPNALVGGGVCWLDIALFPLLVQLLWPALSTQGCAALWPRGSGLEWVVASTSLPSLSVIQNSPRTLFCASTEGAGNCVYAARASPQLTETSAGDAVASIAQNLNALWRGVGTSIAASVQADGPTRTYERINSCVGQLMQTNAVLQADLQAAYDTPNPSGIYFALRVVLYEVPTAWLHHAMLISLLHVVDPTIAVAAAPDWIQIAGMQAAQPQELFLWSDADREPICRDAADLDTRPALWRLICLNAHPLYSFSAASIASANGDAIAEALKARVLRDVQTELPTMTATATAQCYTSVAWTCNKQTTPANTHACFDALLLAYNDTLVDGGGTVCQHATQSPPEFLDPCGFPHHFAPVASSRVNFTLEELDVIARGTAGALQTYLTGLAQAAMHVVADVAVPVDYIGGGAWSDVVADSDPHHLPVARVRPLADFMAAFTAAQGGFNLTDWLHSGICRSTYIPSSACSSQYDTTVADPCMWSSGAPDLDRYNNVLQATPPQTEPSIVLHYGNGIASDTVPLCQLPGIDTEQGVCIAQYLGEYRTDSTICNIQRVQVPAGVEIQGFATSATAASAWTCSNSSMKPCTWTVLNEGAPSMPSWWSANNTWGGPSLYADLDGFQPYDEAGFATMSAWLPHIATDWKSRGCGSFMGLCSVRVRLAPVTPGVGAGVCKLNNDPYSYLRTPDCASLMRDDAASAFATWRGPQTTLYRCGPCTRFHTAVTANPEALFQCSLPGSNNDNVLQAIVDATAYLQDASALGGISRTTWGNGTSIDITAAAADYAPLTRSLEMWRRRNSAASSSSSSSCIAALSPSGCFDGPDTTLLYAITDDNADWTTAVQNPSVRFTMVCESQVYSEDQAARCDAAADGPRQELRDFVDARYRQANGVWMPTVAPDTGIAWTSYAASARTGLFSLMYASTHRDETDVRSAWLLGDRICGHGPTTLEQRICVRSKTRSTEPFMALHPWLGGDFSPFDGLDVCSSSLATTPSLCACACTPDDFCGGANATRSPTQHARLAVEFPVSAACTQQTYASTPLMDANDVSNLCAQAQKPVPASSQCLQPQGLLGDGAPSRTVSQTELHARAGVATTPRDFLVQDMYATSRNGLWAGRTLQQERVTGLERYAFLRMDRGRMHPAHIAFVHGDGTGAPLVVAQVALLKTLSGADLPKTWPSTRAEEVGADARWLSALYPQPAAKRALDWTCPLRAAAFWGGTDPLFAPIVPAPVRASVLFPGLGGAHPLIRSRSARDAVTPFVTTNGACFYVREASLDDDSVNVALADPTHPCGLQGSLRLLQSGGFALSRVMSSSAASCTTYIDTPDVGATLRSTETLKGIASDPTCAALPRLAPFLMRTRGDAGAITQRGTLTTRSEGGDCHMGRALRYAHASRLDIVGRIGCALTAKSPLGAEATCAQQSGIADSPIKTFQRVRPLTLQQLIAKTAVTYRDAQAPDLLFQGPGDAPLQEPESSFGLLYSTSLQQTVAADLAQQCTPAGPWPADGTFWRAFSSSSSSRGLFAENCSVMSPSPLDAQLYARPNASQVPPQAADADNRVWTNNNNWAWAHNSVGSVDQARWARHGQRFAACNASLQAFLTSPTQASVAATAQMARPISLCEPAPTASLQAFCTAMLQFRTNIQNVNCELMGAGACLYEPGTFYVPYAWSASNQQFAADTVLGYYQDILLQPRFKATSSYAQLCPRFESNGAYQAMLAQLSRAQVTQCPGYQMEYLKNLLAQFKQVGYDLLHMAYCAGMFFINAIGAVMNANDPFAADAMLTLAAHYVGEFIKDAEKIIMPILNAAVTVLFGTSSFGKIMSTALGLLCQIFNVFINDFVIPSWCAIIRPALYVIFKAFEVLVGVFSPSAGGKIHDVWVAISGGDGGIDPSTCLGSMVQTIQCDAGKFGIDDNASTYLPAPVATRCWADSTSAAMQMAGGGPFSGSIGDASYLTCTGSDTCAQEPLAYDSALIACSACPSAFDSSNAFDATATAYGCDPTLKRCTCGASVRVPDSCLTSSDCSQQAQAQCAVVTDLQFASSQASTSLACTECGSLGMQPSCVRTTADSLGTCACAAVLAASTLQKCSAQGQRVPLLQATGFCLATADLSANLLSPSLVFPFSALSIAPCLIGLSDNGCVGVDLPLASGGAFTTPLAVILAPAPPSSSYALSSRRRLLSLSSSISNISESERFAEGARRCASLASRALAKECMHWHELGANVSGGVGGAWSFVHADPARALRGIDNGGIAWPLLASAWTLASEWSHKQRPPSSETTHAQPRGEASSSSCAPRRGRRLLQSTFSTLPSLQGAGAIPWTLTQSASSSASCPVLDDAITITASAWVDTIAFYARGAVIDDDVVDTPTPIERAVNETLFSTRVSGIQTNNKGFFPSVASAVLMGYGDRIVDAIVTRDDTREFTGRRLIQELSTCNYTELTFGTRASVNRARGMSLLYIFAATFIAFTVFATFFVPQGFATHLAWFSLFPMLVFWAAYGIAPTCWPMVPPRFAHDLSLEVGSIVPASLEIPRFLVDARCDVRGNLLLDGSYDPACFKSCRDAPFLFKSWQDPAAWWMCELSSTLCAQAADTAARWPFLSDFVSSAAFFGDVVSFAARDPDYTAAFRTCAFFASGELLFSIALAALIVLMLPSLLVALFEIFGAALVMLSQASASESIQ